MRNRISLAAALLMTIIAACGIPAHALPSPVVVRLDADERAEGNRLDVARRVGDVVFRERWPAQVVKVVADGIGDRVVVGLRISGVKFHLPLTRETFLTEIADLVNETMQAAPVDEVDVSVEVPITDPEGIAILGDLAKAGGQTVFSVTVRRGERPAALSARLHAGINVYWNEDWEKSALKVAR